MSIEVGNSSESVQFSQEGFKCRKKLTGGDMTQIRKKDKELFWSKINGRAGLSERIIELVEEFNSNPTYKEVIRLAGRLRLLAEISEIDSYWNEKMLEGYHQELEHLRYRLKQE